MTCAHVRPLLAERSLGILDEDVLAGVDRHLAWCAACRKEAFDLDPAAASLVYALAPATPDADLQDKVVGGVKAAAANSAPATHRRSKMLVAATVAAMLAVAASGFGAVMAGRAARFRDLAETSKIAKNTAQSTFRDLLRTVEFSDPRNSVEMGDLVPVAEGPASGTALTLLAPGAQDMSIVTVASLQLDPRRLPLQVSLVGPRREVLVGTIAKLDSGGSATVAAQLDADLSFFDHVVIRDSRDEVVLRGMLTSAPLQSPSSSP